MFDGSDPTLAGDILLTTLVILYGFWATRIGTLGDCLGALFSSDAGSSPTDES